MFYSKESIEERVNLIRGELTGVVNVPAPDYAMSERWNDEGRIKNGYTKIEDGSWATVFDSQVYLDKMKQDTIELYDKYQDSLRKNTLLVRKNREMEYALRVAEKALKNSLALTKEMMDE